VDPSKIVDIIGQAGKTIKEIIEKFDVSIDLDREKGEVKVAGSQKGKVEAAKEYIIQITQKDLKTRGGKKEVKNIDNFNIGEEFDGEIKKIATFGAFVSLRDGVDGLLHISKIKSPIKEGDRIKVKVSEIKAGKISLDLI
ncbi:MAG: S1 RNA-binding domain-containing protein, partial [Campylobacter sp.]|nr:S1 RNA-binding domain-containing protein [Campylobacter sp.]